MYSSRQVRQCALMRHRLKEVEKLTVAQLIILKAVHVWLFTFSSMSETSAPNKTWQLCLVLTRTLVATLLPYRLFPVSCYIISNVKRLFANCFLARLSTRYRTCFTLSAFTVSIKLDLIRGDSKLDFAVDLLLASWHKQQSQVISFYLVTDVLRSSF